jgi:hypothetical protein
MPKRATPLVLSEKEQEGLLQITRRHRSEQQVILRARIVLAAAQGHANVQIGSRVRHPRGYCAPVAGSLGRMAGNRHGDPEPDRAVAGCSPLECSPSLAANNAVRWLPWPVKLPPKLDDRSASGRDGRWLMR